jgi:hypothetical protein
MSGVRYMHDLPITLRTRPLKMVLLALGSGIFVIIGIWLLPRQPNVAFPCIIFFGLCAAVAMVSLLPNSSYLTLTEQGFLFASLFRKHFVAWSNVQSFMPVKVQFKSMVGWTYSPEFRESKRIRWVNAAVAGVEAALPDTYGMPAEQLAELMNELRGKYRKATL